MVSGRAKVGVEGISKVEEILERMDSLLVMERGLKKETMHLEDRGCPPPIWTVSFCPNWGPHFRHRLLPQALSRLLYIGLVLKTGLWSPFIRAA